MSNSSQTAFPSAVAGAELCRRALSRVQLMQLHPFAALMALFSSGWEVLRAYVVTRFKHSVVSLRCWMSVFYSLLCSLREGEEDFSKGREAHHRLPTPSDPLPCKKPFLGAPKGWDFSGLPYKFVIPHQTPITLSN